MSPASPGRIHQILVTTPQTPTRIKTNADTGCVKEKKWLEWIENKTEMNGHKGHAKYISYSANGFRRTLQDYR